jgi:hypothetical protein
MMSYRFDDSPYETDNKIDSGVLTDMNTKNDYQSCGYVEQKYQDSYLYLLS